MTSISKMYSKCSGCGRNTYFCMCDAIQQEAVIDSARKTIMNNLSDYIVETAQGKHQPSTSKSTTPDSLPITEFNGKGWHIREVAKSRIAGTVPDKDLDPDNPDGPAKLTNARPGIFNGRVNVTGSLDIYFADPCLLRDYLAELTQDLESKDKPKAMPLAVEVPHKAIAIQNDTMASRLTNPNLFRNK